MEALHHLVSDMLKTMSAIDQVGGQILVATRHRIDIDSALIERVVWEMRAVLARCHAEDPLGKLNDIDERLQAAQEQQP